jgi:hypothetical protein
MESQNSLPADNPNDAVIVVSDITISSFLPTNSNAGIENNSSKESKESASVGDDINNTIS